jgi:hypothetical protein
MENAYERYYRHQIGSGASFQNEFGTLMKLPRVYQRGYGIGGIFSKFWSYLQPLLAPAGNFIANELVNTGADVLKGISQNKPIKTVLYDRSVNVVDRLRDKAVDKLKAMAGSGRSRKRKPKPINKAAKRKRIHSKVHAARVKKAQAPRILDIFS